MNKQNIFIEKKEPYVDVILPNYNKENFLEESINSVLNQTYTNWNLFIIDDNSNDQSKKIIKSFDNNKIKKIYLPKNKGVAFCRNLGISAVENRDENDPDVVARRNRNSNDLVTSIPLGRMGEALDIADCAVYLASDESNYVTGSEFNVDAGYTAR